MPNSQEYIRDLVLESDGPPMKVALYGSIDECNKEIGDVAHKLNEGVDSVRNNKLQIVNNRTQANKDISAMNSGYSTTQSIENYFKARGSMNFGPEFPKLMTAKRYTPDHMNPPEWFDPREGD